ncbi:MAG TPA: hypothetical protein VNS09_17230 [Solirubrobacter sp.]|nr:hypothetical protein [Solirubrobacter sp.]
MHTDRIEPAPIPGSREHRLQRLVLLELLVDPPAVPERIADVARRLNEPLAGVAEAVAALARAGLARRQGDCVAASALARYFDVLWPIAL